MADRPSGDAVVTLRYGTTPRQVGFLLDRLHSPLQIEPCAHLIPGKFAPMFTVLAIPGRFVCDDCRRGLLLAVPVERDDLCDHCDAPPMWGDIQRHVVALGQLTIWFSLCPWCAEELGIQRQVAE
jgi:hypothetical protein